MIARLLVANRGEIAIRIIGAAHELGIETVAIYSADDSSALHTRRADRAMALNGGGPAAYLDIEQVVSIAREAGCDAIHPGYGFLSENATFAERCVEAGIVFVGPGVEALRAFGDKTLARALAKSCRVPIPAGTNGPTSLKEAEKFFRSLEEGGAMMIKAIAGGGGRGMRVVSETASLVGAYAECQSEAQLSFGSGDVYVEELITPARHIEVQIVADGAGGVSHLHERECSLQRRRQKLIEVAPSATLSDDVRRAIGKASVRMAAQAGYKGVCTFEFLVRDERFVFLEANPRLQVEHTVTEAVTGVDLVQTQLRIAAGATLEQLQLTQAEIPAPRGFAMQARINMETMSAAGEATPSSGAITAFDLPTGPGVRVDTHGYSGYVSSPRFDSLLAKLIVHSPSDKYGDVVARTYRALSAFRIEGIDTNIGFLQNLLIHPDVAANAIHTRFVETHGELFDPSAHAKHPKRFFETRPIAVREAQSVAIPAGCVSVNATITGVVTQVVAAEGEFVRKGRPVVIVEAMKMEHEVTASVDGVVRNVLVELNENVSSGRPVVFVEPRDADAEAEVVEAEIDLDAIRSDLAEILAAKALLLDEARPDAVAFRRKRGMRTVRENVADLMDEGSFVEYGGLTVPFQHDLFSQDELAQKFPADGMITGIGTVNSATFGDDRSGCMVAAFDYTVLGGSFGVMTAKRIDRMFPLAKELGLPLVIYAEGGGGRSGGEFDIVGVTALDKPGVVAGSTLSGAAPIVGIAAGRCFGVSALMLGGADVVIATENATIGMAGTFMIEAAGLGVVTPEQIGPMDALDPAGQIDILVKDEAEATTAAKRYLSYFQGPLPTWTCADQRPLRHVVPQNRKRSYEMRSIIETLADIDSVLELRPNFGLGMLTALIRIEGRPFGVIANNPMHLSGAIDSAGGEKAARFLQVCDAFNIPVITLVDAPGFMIGPESEASGALRRVGGMWVTASNLSVPVFSIIVRKMYGAGGAVMCAGSTLRPALTVAWPSAEFGHMGIEGNVRVGHKRELEAIEDLVEREAFFQKKVDELYEMSKPIRVARFAEIDNVIDPAETRDYVMKILRILPRAPRTKKYPFVSPW